MTGSVSEEAIRDAYNAGAYACYVDEGYYLGKDEAGQPIKPETEDQVVARLVKDTP